MGQAEPMNFDMRPCPHCGAEITKAARKCRKCGGAVEPLWRDDDSSAGGFERMLAPIGRPASAIAAGYLGLFSVLPFFGIVAIIVSLFALRTLKRRPELSGRGRAYFGLIMGVGMTLLYAVPIVLILFKANGIGR